MSLLALGLALALLTAETDALNQPEHCRNVRGRYATSVTRDGLWVVGSQHVLDVTVDALDRELQQRGWETTVVYGDFTICFRRAVQPRELTNTDAVHVKNYRALRYVRR